MKKLISYHIRQDTPGWPGNPTYYIESHTSIGGGDSANTFVVHIFNHFGTHFDAPRHFNGAGATINELPFELFFYERPLLLDIPKGAGEKVEPKDLILHEAALAGCDLLLIRTGFEVYRQKNPALYKMNGPSISSRSAKYLRDNFTGSMKAVAMDFLSLGAPSDTKDGDLAHRIMLGAFQPGFICIIEDVKMSELEPDKLVSAAAIPLFFNDIDSGPVTMWAEITE